MHSIVSLRRYPVKSMGGETLAVAQLDSRGLVGDRAFAVRDPDARLASGKNTRRMVRRDAVFDFSARTVGTDVWVTDGDVEWTVGDPALDAALCARMGADVTVAPETDVPHFDDGAVSLVGTATLAWCAQEFGIDADPRRLRVNLVVHTAEPFEEENWMGSTLGIGTAVLTPVARIERCRTIDLPQDGVASATKWLKALGVGRDVRMAVYCDVQQPGEIAVGDGVVVRTH
jgi:uncharacterized protein YcbX